MHKVQCPAEERLESIDEKTRRKRIPLSVHVDITYRCNLKCVHCYCQGLSGEFTYGRNEMPTERIISLLDELADSGTLYLTISGGEMLVHPDFFRITDHAKKRHFCLSFITNGTFIDSDMARRLTEFCPRTVQLSLYGMTPEVHDSVTGTRGSFEKTMSAIKFLRDLGNRVILSTVVMDLNYCHAKDMPRFAMSTGAFRHVWTAEIARKNDGSTAPQRRQIGADDIRSLYGALDSGEEPAGVPQDPLDAGLCAPAETNCYISAHGDVYPCIQLIYPMGNVQDEDFSRIWHRDSDVRKELGSVRRYADMPVCRGCDYVRYCQKCIGLAYLETKDMRRCYNTLRVISKVECELRQNREVADEGEERV